MTGITEAAKSRTPLLVLAADTGAAAVRSNFRIDQDALATAVGAVAERVHTPARPPADVVRAYRTARRAAPHGRAQPAAGRPGRAGARRDRARRCPRSRPVPAGRRGGRGAGRGCSPRAQRPVFVAGRGARARRRGAAGAGRRRRGALLATSAVAHGLFAGDAWSLGISGGFASPLAAELIRDADLVVGWGCALNMWTTRHGALIGPDARGRPGRPRRRRARRAPAGRPRRARRRRGHRRPTSLRRGRAAHRLPHRRRSARRSPRAGGWRDVPYDDLTGPGRHRPAHAHDRPGRPAAARAGGRRRLRQLHGLPERVPVRARRGRVLLHPGVPVDRARAWPRRSARRWPARTGCPSRRWATAAR